MPVEEKERVVAINGREGGVGSKTKEEKRWAPFFSFCLKTFTLIRLIFLVFLGAIGVCLGFLTLGLKGNA